MTWLLTAAALAASARLALAAGVTGDYPEDAGPALSALLHGHLHAFAHSEPSMGVLSLILRAPFAAIAYLGSPSELSVYRWGTVPCVASIALLGVWLAALARARGTGVTGQVAIVAVAIFNPLVQSALRLGHPEELLTTSFAIGALVAAAQRRRLAAPILLGLALATKQWAVIVVVPVLLALAPRWRGPLAVATGLAAAITLPAAAIAPGAFLHNQLALAHEHYLWPAAQTWLFLLAPHSALRLSGGLVYHGRHLPAAVVGLLHPLIVAVALAIGIHLARRARGGMTVERLLAAVALAFLLRCVLDTETMPYYHLPLFATLLAWDALVGSRLPLRSLTAAAACYLLFERQSPSVIGSDMATILYDIVSLAVFAALLRTMRRPRPLSAVGTASPAPRSSPAWG